MTGPKRIADRRQRLLGAGHDQHVADAGQLPLAEAEAEMRLPVVKPFEHRQGRVAIGGEDPSVGLQDHSARPLYRSLHNIYR